MQPGDHLKRKLSKFINICCPPFRVYKMRKFKNCSNIIFTHLVKRKTAVGQNAYGNTEIQVKIFRQTQMVVFLGGVREKVTGLSCTNHKMPLNFPFSSQREAWHSGYRHKWFRNLFVRFCKRGEREGQMENGSSRWNVCFAKYLHISFDKQL